MKKLSSVQQKLLEKIRFQVSEFVNTENYDEYFNKSESGVIKTFNYCGRTKEEVIKVYGQSLWNDEEKSYNHFKQNNSTLLNCSWNTKTIEKLEKLGFIKIIKGLGWIEEVKLLEEVK